MPPPPQSFYVGKKPSPNRVKVKCAHGFIKEIDFFDLKILSR